MKVRSELIAGVDIGNTTTEIVLARVDGRSARPVAQGHILTAGTKGSISSVKAAWRLLERLERGFGARCARIDIADAASVQTDVRGFVGGARRTARLLPLDSGVGGDTRSGRGLAVGRPVWLADVAAQTERAGDESGGDVIVLVPLSTDFAEAASAINAAVDAGVAVRGVLAAADEAVLIGNRLRRPVPVVDEVPVDEAAAADRVLLECAPAGKTLRVLSDPVALTAALDLPSDALGEADLVSRGFVDSRAGAVAFVRRPASGNADSEDEPYSWIEFESASGVLERLPIGGNYGELVLRIAPGSVRAVCAPRHGCALDGEADSRRGRLIVDKGVRDFFAPDLPSILAHPLVRRRGGMTVEEVPAAVLKRASRHEEVRALLEDLSGRPVVVAAHEPRAARQGALTTPAAPPDAAVCDIGGGTIDLVGPEVAVTAAGAGELVTLSVALAAGITRGVAERVKRQRSFRVESPSVLHDEDGTRRFADPIVHSPFVGRLCIDTGRVLLPFSATLSPEEWRALRLTLKAATIGANIRRAMRALGDVPRHLILCGGCALDDELVRAVADSLCGGRVVVGRANVAGSLGPRYAVALGLVLCDVR